MGDRLNRTITHTGAVAGNLNWTVFNEQFTAFQNTTSLEFTSLTTSPNGHSGGIMLDAVQVTLPLRATLAVQGSGASLNWTGGVPPYRVQRATDLTSGDWTDVLTNAVPPMTLTLERQAEFYRIVGIQYPNFYAESRRTHGCCRRDSRSRTRGDDDLGTRLRVRSRAPMIQQEPANLLAY